MLHSKEDPDATVTLLWDMKPDNKFHLAGHSQVSGRVVRRTGNYEVIVHLNSKAKEPSRPYVIWAGITRVVKED